VVRSTTAFHHIGGDLGEPGVAVARVLPQRVERLGDVDPEVVGKDALVPGLVAVAAGQFRIADAEGYSRAKGGDAYWTAGAGLALAPGVPVSTVRRSRSESPNACATSTGMSGAW
jgi:hypothetical protein